MKISISFGFLLLAFGGFAHAEFIASRNFEDFAVGPGNLVPSTGAGAYDGFYFLMEARL